MLPPSRHTISSTTLKQGLRSVAQGRTLSDISQSPYRLRFDGYPRIQQFFNWLFGVDANVVAMIDRNAASVYRQILSVAPDENSHSFLLELGTTYQDHAAFTIRVDHGKLILDQHSRPDFERSGNARQLNRFFTENRIENSEKLVIPFDALRKECLRAYIQQTPEPGELNFAGMHIKDGDLAGLQISRAVAAKLIAAGHARAAQIQYVQTERDKREGNIDISQFDLSKVGDLTDLNLQDVNLMDIIQRHPELHEQLKAANLDKATREYLEIATARPERPAEPGPFILHSFLDDYHNQARPGAARPGDDNVVWPDHFLSLADKLDDLHRRDQFLGNVDLDHLRLYKGQATHVKRQDPNRSAAPHTTPENEATQESTPAATAKPKSRIQDQLDFFNTIIDAWAATRNQDRHLAVEDFLSFIECAPALKSELTLFLLSSEGARKPLQHPLKTYLERDDSEIEKLIAARTKLLQARFQKPRTEKPEFTHIPVAGTGSVISRSSADYVAHSTYTGIRGSTVSVPVSTVSVPVSTASVPQTENSPQDALLSTACGVLNYSGTTCLNEEVESAIVDVINQSTGSAPSEFYIEAIATIFANAAYCGYKTELADLLELHCKYFFKNMKKFCAEWQLKDKLKSQSVNFPIDKEAPDDALISA